IKDQDYKSTKRLIQTMVKAAGFGANFLLNTGPMPNGEIQPENVKTLLEMGEWLEKYGETIYGTRKGPISPQDWGASTVSKDGTIYIHILEQKDENLLIPALPSKIKSLTYFDSGEKVKFKETEFGVLLNIPEDKVDEIDTILVLKI
ncbi:MAG: alpha-L-fucosidase, partial [Mariniphaga sp.]|nr:alpha-L-fucosidase [Mariniphaga sp.]